MRSVYCETVSCALAPVTQDATTEEQNARNTGLYSIFLVFKYKQENIQFANHYSLPTFVTSYESVTISKLKVKKGKRKEKLHLSIKSHLNLEVTRQEEYGEDTAAGCSQKPSDYAAIGYVTSE